MDMSITRPTRQQELSELIEKIFENEYIKEALNLFAIQESEYITAILSTENVNIITTNKTNDNGGRNGSMDRS